MGSYSQNFFFIFEVSSGVMEFIGSIKVPPVQSDD